MQVRCTGHFWILSIPDIYNQNKPSYNNKPHCQWIKGKVLTKRLDPIFSTVENFTWENAAQTMTIKGCAVFSWSRSPAHAVILFGMFHWNTHSTISLVQTVPAAALSLLSWAMVHCHVIKGAGFNYAPRINLSRCWVSTAQKWLLSLFTIIQYISLPDFIMEIFQGEYYTYAKFQNSATLSNLCKSVAIIIFTMGGKKTVFILTVQKSWTYFPPKLAKRNWPFFGWEPT